MIKLDQGDVDNIRELLAFKEARIKEIDDTMAKLKAERTALVRGFSYRQLGLKFEVSTNHIRQIKTGRCWGDSCKEQ